MAFLENTDYYNNWDDMSANDQYLSSLDKYMYNTSNTEWNNASGDVSKTIIGTMDPSVPLDYGGKKVGGRCKVKIRTGYSKFTCRGRYDQSGKCIPCDNAQVPRITNDGPVRGGGRGRRPRGRFLRGGFNNASGCGYSNASGSVVSTTPQSGGYTQAEGDALCSGEFGGGSTMSHYECTNQPPSYECTIYCNSTVPGQPPMAMETTVDTSPVRGRGPRKGVDRYRNASGCGYSNAAGGPVINVGGDTYDMQPTLAWNQGDFFGQTQGFGAGNLVCEPCPPRFRGTRQACGGTGCYNRLGQRLAEAGTGIPPGMSVQYTQV